MAGKYDVFEQKVVESWFRRTSNKCTLNRCTQGPNEKIFNLARVSLRSHADLERRLRKTASVFGCHFRHVLETFYLLVLYLGTGAFMVVLVLHNNLQRGLSWCTVTLG